MSPIYRRPLTKSDKLYAVYEHAAQAGEAFLRIGDRYKLHDWAVQPMLYLTGLAEYTIGRQIPALRLLERLQQEYPGYSRYIYTEDINLADPLYPLATAPGVAKLVFYLRLSTVAYLRTDALSKIKGLTDAAFTALRNDDEYAAFLEDHPDREWGRGLEIQQQQQEPDQRRAAALPPVLPALDSAFGKLLPEALKNPGRQAVRLYLREIARRQGPIHELALRRVASVEKMIVEAYFASAKQHVENKDFDAARAVYRQIMAEFGGTEAANRAYSELAGIRPIAVSYYKEQGAKNWQPLAPGQFLRPQTRAEEFYRKMYLEDPDGPQAGVALLGWSRGLGSMGKPVEAIDHLKELLRRFPDSSEAGPALYLLGFMDISNQIDQTEVGVKTLLQVAERYPESPEAPEALWHAAFASAWSNRFADAIPPMQQLHARYPKSIRWQYSEKWTKYFKEKLDKGGTWP